MDQSKNEAATGSTLPTSRVRRQRQHSHGVTPLLATDKLKQGNALLLAMIRDLLKGRFPISLHNVEVNGVWVAHLRLSGQMWTQEAGLQPSEAVKK